MQYYHTKILFRCWPYSPLCIFHVCDSYFSLPLNPLYSGNHLFVLSIYDCFCLITFVHMFCFSDFMCKWNHRVFIFTWLISLNIISSRSNYVVINGKMLLFFMVDIPLHVHTTSSLPTYLLTDLSRLLLYLCYCKECCNEDRGAYIFKNLFVFFR